MLVKNIHLIFFFQRPSSSFLLLQSDELTPLSSGALSKEEMSWIASILCIGGFFGTILFGLLADILGRKYVLCFQGIPSIVRQMTTSEFRTITSFFYFDLQLSWILIYYAENAIHLYISRFLAGLACGGSFVLVPLFVSEISENRFVLRTFLYFLP